MDNQLRNSKIVEINDYKLAMNRKKYPTNIVFWFDDMAKIKIVLKVWFWWNCMFSFFFVFSRQLLGSHQVCYPDNAWYPSKFINNSRSSDRKNSFDKWISQFMTNHSFIIEIFYTNYISWWMYEWISLGITTNSRMLIEDSLIIKMPLSKTKLLLQGDDQTNILLNKGFGLS